MYLLHISIVIFNFLVSVSMGKDSIVSIATCYGLNGLGIECWW
jgi:hypothetical protein